MVVVLLVQEVWERARVEVPQAPQAGVLEEIAVLAPVQLKDQSDLRAPLATSPDQEREERWGRISRVWGS